MEKCEKCAQETLRKWVESVILRVSKPYLGNVLICIPVK